MNRSFISIVLVFSVFGSHCHQAPATTRHYEVGSVYTYDYILGLELNEPNPSSNISSNSQIKTGSSVGYKVLTQVQVTTVWQHEGSGSILRIQMIKPKLQIKSRTAPTPEGFRDHTSHLDKGTMHPLFVHWRNGIVEQTYSLTADDNSLVNIKKGIANLLQFHHSKDKNTIENTPLGQCNLKYSDQDQRHFLKTLLQPCNLTSSAGQFHSRSRNSQTLGSVTESDVTIKVMLTKDNAFVEEAEVTEEHVIRVTAKREVGATISASQSFKLTGTSSSSESSIGGPTVEIAFKELGKIHEIRSDSLVPRPENIPFCETTTCKGIDVLVKGMKNEKMASIKMASAFLQLANRLREIPTEDIAKLFTQHKGALPQLLDVCAATGSFGAHKAAMKVLDFDSEENIENPERYLLGLSLSPSPNMEIVDDLFVLLKKKVKNPKLQETLILTTAALVHSLRVQKNGNPNVGADLENFIIKSLDECPDDNPDCSNLYLRALKNLKSKPTMPKLFEIVEKSSSKVAVVAMKTIHSMPDSYFDNKVHRPILVKIVKQLGRKQDSSTRTLAVDILLRNNPSKDEVLEILHMIKRDDNQHAEVATFMWHRIHEFMETNPKLKTYVSDIVKQEGLTNYHHLSPKGLSTAFSRVFTTNPSSNSTFSNAIEMTGKILKRSSFDVYLRSKDDIVHPLSLGIFASGLASIASDTEVATDETEEEEEATAGMELSLMGVQMRPIIFFVGKGELMGLVWSGAGSERTTALQGNIFLQDDLKQIPLFNGLVAEINIQGGLSFDLAGQIQLSLWHRTANSLVENNAGMVLQSVIRADTSFVRSRIDYTLAGEASLHFTSDINFYDGVVMCLKLTQPEFILKQNIHKIERIPGSKHRLRKAKYKTIPIPGVTYALNKKNSQLCGVMYKDEL